MTRIEWQEGGGQRSALWRSGSGWPAPQKIVIADDTMTADAAYRLALDGTALLWRGDFQNARQLLQALARRIDQKPARSKRVKAGAIAPTITEQFHRHRLAQLQRARTLAMLLIPFDLDYTIPLRRAPDVRQACNEAYGAQQEPFVVSLRELLGLIGAHEWRSKGVPIPALDARIHPRYGVFSPVRGEYVELVAQAPLPAHAKTAFDIGAGTGVLSAVLARRGLRRVLPPTWTRGRSAARAKISRALAWTNRSTWSRPTCSPQNQADLVVCNPPWLPGKPSSAIEYAIYDPDSRMLRGFLGALKDHRHPAAKAGWSCRILPSTSACVRASSCWAGSQRPGWQWRPVTTCVRPIRRPRMRTIRCMRRGRRK
ncbi:methyltransferase [Massilia sp. Se16.2.3]|nr:methyltransferase [Massilia sp. Se16.2.3]